MAQAYLHHRPISVLLDGDVCSDVEVHLELVGVGAEADRVDLVLALVLDPRVDDVLGEDITFEQEVHVRLEREQHLGQ